MVGGHLVPAAVFHGDPRLFADRLEAHLDLGVLARRECRLPPAEDQPFARRPNRNLADLEHLAVGECFDEPPFAPLPRRLERKPPRTARRETEKIVVRPPK